MNDAAYDRIFPVADDVNRPYLEGLEDGRLMLQRCDHDGTYRFPASPVCPECLSPDATWVAASGRGTVWAWIVMHQRYFEAFEDQLPYNVTFVELDEGPLMMSTVPDSQGLAIGAAVQLRMDSFKGHAVPRFEVIADA